MNLSESGNDTGRRKRVSGDAALTVHGDGWAPLPPDFASFCPHCGNGDPGEDYCAGCGERL